MAGALARIQSWARSLSKTQLAAVAVLLPAVPMLGGALLALALFFLAPGRFQALLARLPGESYLRTALFFAPVTLLAIVVMAVLYALERPAQVPTRPRPIDQAVPSPQPRLRRAALGLWVLRLGLPLFAAAVALRSAAFLAPDRFDRLLERLPATSLLRPLSEWAPLLGALWLALGLALVLSAAKGPPADARVGGLGSLESGPLSRAAVALTLLAATPVLLASLGAMAYFLLSPGRLAGLIQQVGLDTALRLGLIFAPAALLGLVLLGALYLLPAGSQTAPLARRVARVLMALALIVVSMAMLGVTVGALVLWLR
jgi:hypothetical protein